MKGKGYGKTGGPATMTKGKNGNTSKAGMFWSKNRGMLGSPKKAVSTPSYK